MATVDTAAVRAALTAQVPDGLDVGDRALWFLDRAARAQAVLVALLDECDRAQRDGTLSLPLARVRQLVARAVAQDERETGGGEQR